MFAGNPQSEPRARSRFAGAHAADERAEDDEVHMRILDAHEYSKARKILVAEKTKAARPAKMNFTRGFYSNRKRSVV